MIHVVAGAVHFNKTPSSTATVPKLAPYAVIAFVYAVRSAMIDAAGIIDYRAEALSEQQHWVTSRYVPTEEWQKM